MALFANVMIKNSKLKASKVGIPPHYQTKSQRTFGQEMDDTKENMQRIIC